MPAPSPRRAGRPLLIVAEEVAPEVVVTLLGKDGPGRYLVIHPPNTATGARR